MAAQMNPVDINDNSLLKAGEGSASGLCSQEKLPSETVNSIQNKRLVKMPAKLNNYECNKLSDHCPGCRGFVSDEENGVVCEKCKAYWHFMCANVTQQQIETIWKDEFLCEAHRNVSSSSVIPAKSSDTVLDSGDEPLQFVTIKVNKYSLDKLSKVKFKLNNLDTAMEIRPKACKRQHTVVVNSTTYQIIMDNLSSFGNYLGGMEVARADTDSEGENVQIQYYLCINGALPVSITCYHTTNKMLIQLRSCGKNKKKTQSTTEVDNQNHLHAFVNNNFRVMIQKVEASPSYLSMKSKLTSALNEIKEFLEQSQLVKPLSQGLNSLKVAENAQASNCVVPSFDVTKNSIQNQPSPSRSAQSTPRRKGKRCNDECETSLSSLKSRVSTLEKEKQCVQQKLETAETHQELLRSTISNKEGLISSQIQIISDHLKTIESQKKLISEHELRSQTHSEFASSFLDIMVSEESDAADPGASNPDLFKQMHDKIKTLEDQVSTCESKLVEEGKEKAILKEKLEESESKFNAKSKELKTLKSQLGSMEERILEKEKEIKRAEEKHGDTQSKVES